MLQGTNIWRFEENDIPVVPINNALLDQQAVSLYLKREDLIHPYISGNKWRKLKYNLLEALSDQRSTLLTFGGAFSNHIAAVAEAGYLLDLKTIGIIRGEAPKSLNATLQKASDQGMRLEFIDRTLYRDKAQAIQQIKYNPEQTYVIPEGGTNNLALWGCAEIVLDHQFERPIDYWCATCGTGGTAAGIITALEPGQRFMGFSILKGGFMRDTVNDLLTNAACEAYNWSINEDYHFGGYAKFKPELIEFINAFKKDYGIALDPIYTGKMVFGVFDLIKKGYFPKGSTVMMVHTGGLQGIKGFNQRFGNLIQ